MSSRSHSTPTQAENETKHLLIIVLTLGLSGSRQPTLTLLACALSRRRLSPALCLVIFRSTWENPSNSTTHTAKQPVVHSRSTRLLRTFAHSRASARRSCPQTHRAVARRERLHVFVWHRVVVSGVSPDGGRLVSPSCLVCSRAARVSASDESCDDAPAHASRRIALRRVSAANRVDIDLNDARADIQSFALIASKEGPLSNPAVAVSPPPTHAVARRRRRC